MQVQQLLYRTYISISAVLTIPERTDWLTVYDF